MPEKTEKYEYRLLNRVGTMEIAIAESLDKAIPQFGFPSYKLKHEFPGMAVIYVPTCKAYLGITWKPI